MPKYIDIHTHLHHLDFDNDRDEVIARMRAAEVGAITVGTDYEESRQALALAVQHDDIWATVGLHPTDNTEETFDAEKYKELAEDPRVVAIGECGLDYYRSERESVYDRQKDIFWKQLLLAVELDKPLMIHCRPTPKTMDAHNDMLILLSAGKDRYREKLRGNIHFFTGTKEIAERYFKLGFTISFPGVITFTNDYDEVIKSAPLDMIMVETDAPYAAPAPHRGERNEPAYVVETVKKIADLRGGSVENMAKALVLNTQRWAV